MVRDYEDESQDSEMVPYPVALGHWLEEQYIGDDRFDAIEIDEPGLSEGETVRIRFICTPQSHFLVSVFEEDGFLRIGLATEDEELSQAIEAAASENGDSLTEFVEIAMDSEDELEHEVTNFHSDMFYFCSDIPYQREEDLASSVLRDEVIYYLDGIMMAFFDFVEKKQ